MPSFKFFDKTLGRIGDGSIDLDTNQIWAYLSNTTPNKALDNYRSDLADIGTQNGYTNGGQQMTGVTWTEEAGSPQGVWVLDCANFSWTASGGNIGPARYLVFYAKGAGSPNEYLLGFVDNGAEFTITDTNSLNVTVANGLFENKATT
jgi:hypothetical protein